MKNFVLFVSIIAFGFILFCCGGGGGGSDSNATSVSVKLFGSLNTGSQPLKSSATKSDNAQAIIADDLWIVALDETGTVQASAHFSPPLGAVVDFVLELPVEHEYVITFVDETIDGSVLGVFMLEDEGQQWTVFSLPDASQDIDLGVISIDQSTLTASSETNLELVDLLPPAETEYADYDQDLIPDDFDWDADGDGVPSGDSTSIFYSLNDGQISVATPAGHFNLGHFSQEDIVLAFDGLYDTVDHTFTINPSPGPKLFIDLEEDLVLQQLLPPDVPITFGVFNVWMDSPISVDKNGRVLSGTFRLSPWEPWRPTLVTANPDTDGAGTPGFDIELVLFGEIAAAQTLTWEQFDAIGDDPASVDGYLAIAWLTLRSIEFTYQNLRQMVDGYEWCYTHKDRVLTDAGEGNPVTFDCDVFPGDNSQGTRSYRWFDTSADNNPTLNTGDSFRITYDNCWIDDPDDPVDEIFNGSIDLKYYFDFPFPVEHTGANSALFDNLTQTKTVETNGVYTIDTNSQVTVNSSNISPERDGHILWLTFLDYVWF